MPLPVLPLDVLSHIISLLPEPYYPPASSDRPLPSSRSPSRDPPLAPSCPTPALRPPLDRDLAAQLDPYIPCPSSAPGSASGEIGPAGVASADISAASRASHALLEAARPWLWENVELRSGRGWLAVVNALTEEVVDVDVVIDKPDLADPAHGAQSDGLPELPAVSPSEAFARPMTVSGIGRYVAVPPAGSTYPEPYAHALAGRSRWARDGGGAEDWTARAMRDQSPPQPAHPAALLTPPGSRDASPRPAPAIPLAIKTNLASNPSSGPASSPHPAQTSSPLSPAQARLRGRSRSPRRSLEVGEGISAVLARARSLSTHRQPGAAGAGAGLSPERAAAPISVPSPQQQQNPGPGETETRRSASTSAHVRWPLVRGPSMHRTRTISDGWEEDEGEDNLGPLALHLSRTWSAQRPAAYSPSLDSPNRTFKEDSEYFRGGLDEDHGHGAQASGGADDFLPMPGPYIRHLSFAHFRTVGSRRTQDEAVRGRFVTAGRLEGVIKNAPNLVSLAMTEYVDSALSFPVLEELFFRGHRRPRAPRRLSTSMSRSRARARSESVDPWNSPIPHPEHSNQADPPRPVYVPYEEETEDEMWARRGLFTALEALDLTGCVSRAFTEGMEEFWETWLMPDEEAPGADDEREGREERGRGRGRARHRTGEESTSDEADEAPVDRARKRRRTMRTPLFYSLKRLSLRACTTLEPAVLQSFILSFPSLTHLDLSGTRVPTSLLAALTDRPPRGVRLVSLSLARCGRLDPSVVVTFLTSCPVTFGLEELSLYVPLTQTNRITTTDVDRLLTAPAIKGGRLRYLDVSGLGLTPAHLASFPAQPALLSLGLSHMPALPLGPIAEFLLAQAPNVEILTLTGTALSTLDPHASAMKIALEVHARLLNPCTTVPFSLAGLSLGALAGKGGRDLRPGPTRLRVVELGGEVRRALGEGAEGEWRVVKSKGGRGWYVDTSAGWVGRETVPVGSRVDADADGADADGGMDGGEKQEGQIFVRHLPGTDARRRYLTGLSDAAGRVGSSVGWHSRKMEVVRGWGMMGREGGLAGVGAFAFEE